MRRKKVRDIFMSETAPPPPPICQEMDKELIEAGAPGVLRIRKKFVNVELRDPLTVLINTNVPVKPYAGILVKYGEQFARLGMARDVEGVVRALARRGVTEATPFLLSLWDVTPSLPEDVLWMVGNALTKINDPKADPAILELCRTRSGGSLQMLLDSLARRRRPEAFRVLVDKLEDPELAGHAMAALRKFGDPAAIPYIERVRTEPGTYAHREKPKALERLRNPKAKG